RRYLAEAAYRFNRRFRLREMLPRLATAMMRCKPCPEPLLRAAVIPPLLAVARSGAKRPSPTSWQA
ncbi:hypothetical protein ACUZXJ_22835, partial [Xanthomonas euvesicatoria]